MTRRAASASWKTLAAERIEDKRPIIPLGRRFWPLAKAERRQIEKLFAGEDMRNLATLLRSRDGAADVKLADAAYWMKG